MSLNVGKEVALLQRMTVKELKAKYTELFGDETRTGNRPWLVKRIVWRMQAVAEGGLSERARQRAEELANETDLRMSPPKPQPLAPAESARTTTHTIPVSGDDRLPLPGTILLRQYKGRSLQVRVLPHGFEYKGDIFKSLSAVAKQITGSHCNGYLFFRLNQETPR